MRVLGIVVASILACALAATATAFTPSDPEGNHPAYSLLNLPEAWEISTGSPDVVVAVVDSGIDAAHAELAGAVLPGYDFVDRDEDPSDPPGGGHGTAVSGVAAARANNGIGGVGACFRCRVLPLRVLGRDGVAFNTNNAAAIDYAVDHGAAVINISLYGEHSPPRLREAVVRARAAGVLVVAAAGNDASTTPEYPAAFPEAVSVAAATSAEALATFSSRGSWVKLAASDCAPVTVLGGGTLVGCGTSVSTPLVAGTVALLRAHAPFAGADDLERALTQTARPVAGTQFGLVDAAAALRAIGNPPPRLRPAIVGDAIAGRTLEAFSGIWSGAGIGASFQWERCTGDACGPIEGATGRRYATTTADGGRELRVLVSAARLEPASSARTPAVAVLPRAIRRPAIVGRPRLGNRLVARVGVWEGTDLKLVVNWQRCRQGVCEPVALARTYRVRSRDRGYRLKVEVIASNPVGRAEAFSKLTNIVR
jgi:hypothetical protein